jgi:hypothetical protein
VQLKIEICKHGSLCHASHDANEMMGNYGVIDETKLQSRFLEEFALLSLQPKNFMDGTVVCLLLWLMTNKIELRG